MAPGPVGDAEESTRAAFLGRVQSTPEFSRLLGGFSRKCGNLDLFELQGFSEELCGQCWSEAHAAAVADAAAEGPLAAARSEVKRLSKQLQECNLAAVKQREQSLFGGSVGQFGPDTIIFHEPLQYLDPETKDLVVTIVCDKIRQLGAGSAPPSLVRSLQRHSDAIAPPGGFADAEELEEVKRQLEEANARNKRLQASLEEARDRAAAQERELADTRRNLAAAEAKVAEADLVMAQLRADCERLRAEAAELRAELGRVTEELQREREANAELQAEVKRLEERVRQAAALEAELRARIAGLEAELVEFQARFDALKREADAMREELARRNNTRTHGTQTKLTGPKLDEQAAETKRLKVMLQELQEKFKEFVDRCRRAGLGREVAQVVEDLGLSEILEEKTVFQRLYKDATERVHRLERLRERIQTEKKAMWPGAGTPRSLAMLGERAAEVSVLNAVEQSPLVGLQSLAPEAAPDPAARPPRPRGVDAACGEEVARPPKLKTSASLPALPKAALNQRVLDLHATPTVTVSKRRTKTALRS